VVGTIHDSDLAKPVPEGRVYLSAAQIPTDSMGVVVRPAPGAQAIAAAAIRSAVQSVDPGQAISDVRTMEQWIGQALSGRRTPMTLLTIFGAVALLLSAIGIYGVLAFSAGNRSRSISGQSADQVHEILAIFCRAAGPGRVRRSRTAAVRRRPCGLLPAGPPGYQDRPGNSTSRVERPAQSCSLPLRYAS
jgi:hypothetical protein